MEPSWLWENEMLDDSGALPEVFVIDDTQPFHSVDAHERGRAEGEKLAYRHALLRVLELRFGAVPDAAAERIEGEADVSRLAGWHADAITVSRLEDHDLLA